VGVNVVSVRTNVCATNRQGLASQHGQIKNGTHQPVPLKKKKNVEPDAIVTIIVQRLYNYDYVGSAAATARRNVT
jgi:hypothetical protein